MKNLRVKVFRAHSRSNLEKKMNDFLKTIPESFLRDLGYAHSLLEDEEIFSAMIVYEERHKLNKG